MLSPLIAAVVDSNTATMRLADDWHASRDRRQVEHPPKYSMTIAAR
jgi:hypothetical protein